jgi:hypothetical protein
MVGRAAEHPRCRARWTYWRVAQEIVNRTADSDVVTESTSETGQPCEAPGGLELS